ncbi:hypothetical protein [Streptomyces sp. NPDC059874]|uniref:hypothetical protein n=1 Tax=Streptomyces sp. NPDC059874 TaxID=3346983 RepID=UPI00364B18D5
MHQTRVGTAAPEVHLCTSAVLSPATEDARLVEVAAAVEPSADLLDRALVGWERFLSTFEGAPDE